MTPHHIGLNSQQHEVTKSTTSQQQSNSASRICIPTTRLGSFICRYAFQESGQKTQTSRCYIDLHPFQPPAENICSKKYTHSFLKKIKFHIIFKLPFISLPPVIIFFFQHILFFSFNFFTFSPQNYSFNWLFHFMGGFTTIYFYLSIFSFLFLFFSIFSLFSTYFFDYNFFKLKNANTWTST